VSALKFNGTPTDYVEVTDDETTTDVPPRRNPISFYVFDLGGHEGVGSYYQEPVQAGEWIHVAGIAEGQNTSIYKNGVFKQRQSYAGIITAQPGAAHRLTPFAPA
jgi:hypothetical protein